MIRKVTQLVFAGLVVASGAAHAMPENVSETPQSYWTRHADAKAHGARAASEQRGEAEAQNAGSYGAVGATRGSAYGTVGAFPSSSDAIDN